MKRIINGRTYDTDNANLVAENTQHDSRGQTVRSALYRAHDGVFFAVDEIEREHRNNGDWHARKSYEWEVVGDAGDARRFCEKRCLTIFENIEDVLPEAHFDHQSGVTISMQLPTSLRSQMMAESRKQNISLNAFALRCVERGLANQA
jgi:hypothetical protein